MGAEPLIILNPTAGAGRAAKVWARLVDEVRDWPSAPTIVETSRPGDAVGLACRAVGQGTSLVVAAGGDGTAHEVVQGLMEADATTAGTAFAHLPLGTGCDLARGLGQSTDPRGQLRRLPRGRIRNIDVGVAELQGPEGVVRRYFLNAANVGMGPAVARRVQSGRSIRRLGKPAYMLASLQELLAARPYQIRWRTDDGRAGEPLALNIFVCNGPSVAGGMRPSPDASFDSGSLHVVVVGALRLGAALVQMGRLARERPFDHPLIESFTCQSVDLDGGALEVETDGEIAGTLPARIWVRAGGLMVRGGR